MSVVGWAHSRLRSGLTMEFYLAERHIEVSPNPVQQMIDAKLRDLGRERRIGLRVWAETSALNLVTKKDIAGLLPANSGARIESHKLFGIPSNLIVIID